LAPAFPAIRALRAFANSVQSQIRNKSLGRKEDGIRRQPHPNPRRLLRLVQGWINLRTGHRAKVTTLKPLQKLIRRAAFSILQQRRAIRIKSRAGTEKLRFV